MTTINDRLKFLQSTRIEAKGEGWNSNKKTVVINADRHLINSRRRDSSKQIEVNILKKKIFKIYSFSCRLKIIKILKKKIFLLFII